MTDVAVVGSGVAGASVAFFAARAGARVVLIDDRRTGRATAAGAGIIAPWATSLTGDVYDLYSAGADAYPEVLDALADVGIDDVGYARNGTLVVGPGEGPAAATVERLRRRCATSEVAGTIELVDGDAAAARFPPLAEGWHGWFVPGGARVDGRRLAAGFATAVGQLGGSVRSGTARLEAGALLVDGEPLDADHVVVAGGVWTDDVLGSQHHTPVVAQRGQICHLRVGDTGTGRWPSVLPPADHYIVPFDDGRVVVGATRETGVVDPHVTAGGVAEVLDRALTLAPGLADATLIETRVGLRPLPSGAGRPTIGPVDDSTWVITGFGAIGLTIGPLVGARVASAIAGGGHGAVGDRLLAPFAPTIR